MKKILTILNFIIPIVSLIVLELSEVSENFITIMTLTLVVGWMLPYITLLLTGITYIYKNHLNKSLILNIISSLLSILIITLIILIYEKSFRTILIEYIIITIMNIINIINIIIYKKKNPSEKTLKKKIENEKIKKAKKENNGIIK